MKKLILILTLCFMFVSLFSIVSFAGAEVVEKPEIKIIIDGKAGTYSSVPIVVNGRTLLPLRELLVNLGVPNDDAHIIWDAKLRTVTVYKDSTLIFLEIDSANAQLDEVDTTLDSPAIIYKNRTYIPARFIAQGLGKKVDWDGSTNSVLIGKDNAAIKEVTVGTAEEFVREIASNKRIILKPGVYDLSLVEQVSNNSNSVTWLDWIGGKELNLRGISNLFIEGSSTGKSEIVTTQKDIHMINFKYCNNITMKNITVGNNPQQYSRNGGGLRFFECEDISISNSELSGWGGTGIGIYRVKRFVCDNSVLRKCSKDVIGIYGSEAVKISGCKMLNNEAYSNIINTYDSTDVTIDQCEISGNNNFGWSFIDVSGKSNLVLNNCKIINNSQTAIEEKRLKGNISFFTTVDYNGVCDSKITVKNTEISNNTCDYLGDMEDAITIENCTFNNNTWLK